MMPGKFAPDEAQRAAVYLGIPWETFKKKLVLNYLWDEVNGVHLFQPKKKDDPEWVRVASDEWTNEPGTCIFLENDRCSIHEVKPIECRETLSCEKTTCTKAQYFDIWEKAGRDARKE